MISEEMEQLVKLFDFALTSDNPAVKKALKNLLLLVSIVEPEEANKTPGPLSQLQDEIMKLRGEILKLHNDVAMINERDRIIRQPAYPTYPTSPSIYPNSHQYPPYSGTWVVNTSSNTIPSTGAVGSITSSLSSMNLSNSAVTQVDATTIDSLIREYNTNSKDSNLI